jgi:penicillin-binding protein 2
VVIDKTKKDSDYLIRDLKMRPENLGLIWEGMKEACQTGGTGWPLFDYEIPVACKTGTAEYGLPVKTHAWFTAFAPADKPEIAVTVLIEDGGQGSDVAAPVARRVLEKYFEGKN